MQTQFRNLIFEGGGVKGIACVGAMQVLEERGVLNHIRRVGGASVGAINALLFALGYSVSEQLEILRATSLRDFQDHSLGFARDVRRLLHEFGWNKGQYFAQWVGTLIAAKLGHADATFADLHTQGRASLYVIGTNLATGYAEIFSHERHPAMPLRRALRISMAIPLFFTAVRHGARRDLYVDGGITLNYPIKLFDRLRYLTPQDIPNNARQTPYYQALNLERQRLNPEHSPYIYNRQTLGIRLDTAEEIGLFRYNAQPQGKLIKNLKDYTYALLRALARAQENQHLHSDDWQRTIYINTLDITTLDFHITAAKKELLFQEGVRGAQSYFTWFNDLSTHPINRI